MKLRVNLAAKRPAEGISPNKTVGILLAVLGLWLVADLSGTVLIVQRRSDVAARLAATSARGGEGVQTAVPRAEAEQAERILRRRAFHWSQVLNHLERVWLEGIQVRSIEPDFDKRTLAIQVLAQNEAVFRAYLGNLLNDKAFTEVLLLRQENIEVKDGAGRKIAAVRCDLRVRGGF